HRNRTRAFQSASGSDSRSVFTDIRLITPTVTIRTVTILTPRPIITVRLSITAAVTGLIIGGTAAGYIIGTTATDAKFLTTRGRGSNPSPPRDHRVWVTGYSRDRSPSVGVG